MLEEGMYYQPTYRILPSYATVIPDVRWSSSNPDIAKVDEKSGEIIALNEGTATIIAKLDGTEIEANVNAKKKLRPLCRIIIRILIRKNILIISALAMIQEQQVNEAGKAVHGRTT